MSKDLKHYIGLIKESGAAMERHRKDAETILRGIEGYLIGKRITIDRRGIYEITNVDLSHDGHIMGWGRKIKTDGKLGNQAWELVEISDEMLGL